MDNSLQGKSSHFHINQHNSGSEREYEDVILTDRTNDTMADLNFTLTSDDSDPFVSNDTCVSNDASCKNEQNICNTNCNVDLSVRNSPRDQSIKNKNRKAVRKLFVNPSPKEREAATKIVAYAKGYLVRRLMHTERVQSTVQTIRDALVCALQLHTDQAGIRGADIDLHRRLIQQITAACYNLHETFVLSDPAERCAIISSDRARKHALANRPPRRNSARTPSQSRTTLLSSSPLSYPNSNLARGLRSYEFKPSPRTLVTTNILQRAERANSPKTSTSGAGLADDYPDQAQIQGHCGAVDRRPCRAPRPPVQYAR
ncbi:Centriolar coiled-coil protein of 110 kDa [Eumeta japonica]|uniref:Centriolar coiled-coil protein of 110 kDa n=1 Tax=Eumeta variegata TaxID=151549 RepID=A0A4C1X6X8_EUMVA|nr:Centriolar coiled-coil protein of 110 kDa [Eumeta japonica]